MLNVTFLKSKCIWSLRRIARQWVFDIIYRGTYFSEFSVVKVSDTVEIEVTHITSIKFACFHAIYLDLPFKIVLGFLFDVSNIIIPIKTILFIMKLYLSS